MVSAGPNGIYNVHYDVSGDELVSVIIPTKNGYDNIERCVSSIIDKTDYPNYEIIIADNGSDNPHMQDLYQRFAKKLVIVSAWKRLTFRSTSRGLTI